MAPPRLSCSRSTSLSFMNSPTRASASQAVLPGATATEFWDIAGMPVHQLPTEIVMSADDLVDAALAGLDIGETVTIPSLPNQAEWDRYEASAPRDVGQAFKRHPGPRYNVRQSGRLSA